MPTVIKKRVEREQNWSSLKKEKTNKSTFSNKGILLIRLLSGFVVRVRMAKWRRAGSEE